jgi:hypothetical protein
MFRPADAGIPALVEAQEWVSVLGNANANAPPDAAGRAHSATQPNWARPAEIDTIQTPVNGHGRRQSAWTAAEVVECGPSASALHEIDPVQGLQGSKKNSGANPFFLAGNVKRVPIPINKIDVGMPAFQKGGLISLRFAYEGMCRRITDEVGFGFNDPAAHPPLRRYAYEGLADQPTRQCPGIYGQLSTLKPSDANHNEMIIGDPRNLLELHRLELKENLSNKEKSVYTIHVMTHLLKHAFAKASRLPKKEQNALARRVLEELASDKRWDKAFASSASKLAFLANEALKEHTKGKTRPLHLRHS